MRLEAKRPTGTLLIAVLLASLLVASACATPELDKRPWVEIRSPNFRLVSQFDEAESVAFIERLELFRSVVLEMTNARRLDARIPTRIYLFDRPRDFMHVVGNAKIAGAFLPGLRDNTVILREVRGIDTMRVLLHEYTHFITSNATSKPSPAWYNEGFAEYLSTMDTRGDDVRIGMPPADRIDAFRYLPWIDLEDLIDPEYHARMRGNDVAMYYAECWALVHYLHHGQSDGRVTTEHVSRYIRLVGEGKPSGAAFEAAFGMDVDAANGALHAYVYGGRFPAIAVKRSHFDAPVEIATRRMPKAEIANEMGDLLIRAGEWKKSGPHYARAIELDPTLARAHSGFGDSLKAEGEWDRALPYFERAVALAPDDPLCELDLAEYWYSRAPTAATERDRLRMLKRAHRHFVASWKIDDGIPETYLYYGLTLLLAGRDPRKALESIENAGNLLPGNVDIWVYTAIARLEVGDTETAVSDLRSAIGLSHPHSTASQRARALLDAIAEVPPGERLDALQFIMPSAGEANGGAGASIRARRP